ncbi:MAG: hypothetical protein PHX10_02245 [Gallionellaceae bacterium]|nr:hypothetical protein [Gallionellaceae bacterium]
MKLEAGMAMTVDDRPFVIGLAELYRQAMKDYEATTLLPLAEAACKALAFFITGTSRVATAAIRSGISGQRGLDDRQLAPHAGRRPVPGWVCRLARLFDRGN